MTEVLNFWFGDLTQFPDASPELRKRWFIHDAAFDQAIRDKFFDLQQIISQASFDQLVCDNPLQLLAHIIVLDQFTRNLYRGKADAICNDAMALKLALYAIERQHDLALLPVQRCFIYLPLEHSEDLAMQQLSVEKHQQLLDSLPDSRKAHYQSNMDYAQLHADIIAKFQRFPHRNVILGRQSTAEELEYLSGKSVLRL